MRNLFKSLKVRRMARLRREVEQLEACARKMDQRAFGAAQRIPSSRTPSEARLNQELVDNFEFFAARYRTTADRLLGKLP